MRELIKMQELLAKIVITCNYMLVDFLNRRKNNQNDTRFIFCLNWKLRKDGVSRKIGKCRYHNIMNSS